MIKLLVALPHNLFIGLAGIIGFGLLVVVHEFGHFFFCKLFGVKTPTFSVGFGPKLLTKKIGDTEFALSAIPLGGYVEIAGLAEVGQGDQKESLSTEKNSFSQKPYYQKILILIGGISFNLLFAFGALWLIFMLGVPKSPIFPLKLVPTIQNVLPGSPAEAAGLQPGDTIITINGSPLEKDVQKLIEEIHASANKPLNLRIERYPSQDGNTAPIETSKTPTSENQTSPSNRVLTEQEKSKKPAPITLDIVATPNEQGLLGISAFESESMPALSFLAALKQAALATWNVSKGTVSIFLNLFRGRNLDKVGGPLSIFEATIKGAGQGLSIFLLILAIISINLAVLNLIPLPIADGGQILIQTIEAIIRREIPLRIKEVIFMACWILFILLALYMSAKDITRMAGNSISQFFNAIGNFFTHIFSWFKK
jgi:regulator of sigma E protease